MKITPIRGVAILQDIKMHGPTKRYSVSPHLNPFKAKKRRKKGEKKAKKPKGSKFRDYRGVDGALKDAE